MFKIIFGLLVIVLFSPRLGFAAPAVLIEEGKSIIESDSFGWKTKEKPVSVGKSVIEHYNDQYFKNAFDLRTKRRVGIGATVAGASGLAGALIELNFTPENSVIVGFGGGPKYNSFSTQWRYLFGEADTDQIIHPYFGFGYSRWYSVSGNSTAINNTTPSFLGSRYLSEEEKRTGRFEKNLLVPNLGLQYFQLDGPYKGLGVFVEVAVLVETSELSPVPTGGVGTIFYF